MFLLRTHVAVRYFLTTLQLLVVNLITLNITIAVLTTRYTALTQEFSREKYERWLTKRFADAVFKQSLIRGGRCRAFLLHVRECGQLSRVEVLQLNLMTTVEEYISQRRWYVFSSAVIADLTIIQVQQLFGKLVQVQIKCMQEPHPPLTPSNSFFFFEESVFSTSVWQRGAGGASRSLSHRISDQIKAEYLRLYNSPSSRMLFPEKAIQV